MAEKIVTVDGQGGCGKTLFSPIIAALDRVELLSYTFEVEFVCPSWFNIGSQQYLLQKHGLDKAGIVCKLKQQFESE